MNPHRKNDGAAEARIAELEAEIAEMRERAKHGLILASRTPDLAAPMAALLIARLDFTINKKACCAQVMQNRPGGCP